MATPPEPEPGTRAGTARASRHSRQATGREGRRWSHGQNRNRRPGPDRPSSTAPPTRHRTREGAKVVTRPEPESATRAGPLRLHGTADTPPDERNESCHTTRTEIGNPGRTAQAPRHRRHATGREERKLPHDRNRGRGRGPGRRGLRGAPVGRRAVRGRQPVVGLWGEMPPLPEPAGRSTARTARRGGPRPADRRARGPAAECAPGADGDPALPAGTPSGRRHGPRPRTRGTAGAASAASRPATRLAGRTNRHGACGPAPPYRVCSGAPRSTMTACC